MTLSDSMTRRNFLIFSAVVALSSLAFAYTAQYFFKINPCILCLYERYVYWGVALTGFIGFFRYPRFFFKVSGLILLGGSALGLYHLGVELHWWQGTAACHGVSSQATSIEELRAMLKSKPVARCDQANWHILGISATTLNLAWFLGFLGLWGLVEKKPINARQPDL